ncbi:MAG TPA: hypothetical protein VFK40_07490 [Nitrososphaeraceae archaeon]|nr:hypothetical protein [Nitrososphaeraceae archaeon]
MEYTVNINANDIFPNGITKNKVKKSTSRIFNSCFRILFIRFWDICNRYKVKTESKNNDENDKNNF